MGASARGSLQLSTTHNGHAHLLLADPLSPITRGRVWLVFVLRLACLALQLALLCQEPIEAVKSRAKRGVSAKTSSDVQERFSFNPLCSMASSTTVKNEVGQPESSPKFIRVKFLLRMSLVSVSSSPENSDTSEMLKLSCAAMLCCNAAFLI